MTDFLDPQALALAVVGGTWQHVDVLPSAGSTNADLAAMSRAGVAPGRVLVTGNQTSGRGRLARRWETPPDTCVATSVLVAPRRPVQDWGWLPLLVGMAVHDGLRAATGIQVGLKWPNDVLVHDRKLCGILCESVGDLDEPRAVLGWGINVALRADQLPVPTATSTRLEGSDVSATAIAAAVLASLETWYRRWDDGEDVAADYRRRCVTIGRRVAVRPAGGLDPVHGTVASVDDDGSLVVDTADGVRVFVAGDVEHVRPAS